MRQGEGTRLFSLNNYLRGQRIEIVNDFIIAFHFYQTQRFHVMARNVQGVHFQAHIQLL